MEDREQGKGQGPAGLIVGDGPVRLWGLTGRERLERQLRAAGVTRFPSEDDGPAGEAVLLLRADWLFDARTLRDLLECPGTLLEARGANDVVEAVAAHVAPRQAKAALAALRTGAGAVDGINVRAFDDLPSNYNAGLLKADRPLLLPVRAERTAELERYLFDASYKGVTDLVTKWLWPAPARAATKLCTRFGIRPNTVTAASLVLVIAATWLFAESRLVAGLAAAWGMTFLDTVDGKLARVTVTSTKFGHLFDHAIDLVHPPIWYVAWGAGLVGGMANLGTLSPALEAILLGYIGGRLAEGGFEYLVGGFSMFTWRPFDSYFRLITGRRNPNLLLLTGSAMMGCPAEGLTAVAVWTVASSVILGLRLLQAGIAKANGRPLSSWLRDLDPRAGSLPGYAKPFTGDLAAVARLTRRG
jgi:hypothetical protein